MNVWMWLLIGFLTGLVVAAIISLLRSSSTKNEGEIKNDTAAKLAKSEVKVTVLEDKLRLAESDNLTLQAKMETDYKDQLATAEAEYRANVAIVESENLALTAALADAKLELEKSKGEYENENKALAANLADAHLELEKVKAEYEAKVEGFVSDSEISTIVVDKNNDNLEGLIVVAESEDITQESIHDQNSEELNSSEGVLPVSAIIAESFIRKNEESDASETGFFSGEEEDLNNEFQGEVSIDNLRSVEEVDPNEHYSTGKLVVGAAVLGKVPEKSSGESNDSEELHTLYVVEEAEDHFPESGEDSSWTESADLNIDPDREVFEISSVEDTPSQFEEIQQTEDSIVGPETIEDDDGVEIADALGRDPIDIEHNEEPAVISEEITENSRLPLSIATGAGLAIAALAANEGDELEQEESEPGEEVVSSGLGEESGAVFESEVNNETDTKKAATVEEIEEDAVVAVPEWPEDDSVWLGEYFNNMKLEGEPALVREDAEVNFDWEYGSPAPELNVDGFSVRWTRKADLPPGLYRFTVTSDDGARLWVNERLVISAWYDHSQMTFRREMELPGGPVNLRLEYYEKDMTASVQCSWERIG